jgi:hypothetical protein
VGDGGGGAAPFDSFVGGAAIHATQQMGQHSDPRMTNPYTLAAVDSRLRAAAARLARMLPPLK